SPGSEVSLSQFSRAPGLRALGLRLVCSSSLEPWSESPGSEVSLSQFSRALGL
ncbi:Kelch-like protein 23, partial [Dissostichus eleginoides]